MDVILRTKESWENEDGNCHPVFVLLPSWKGFRKQKGGTFCPGRFGKYGHDKPDHCFRQHSMYECYYWGVYPRFGMRKCSDLLPRIALHQELNALRTIGCIVESFTSISRVQDVYHGQTGDIHGGGWNGTPKDIVWDHMAVNIKRSGQ